MAEPQGAPVLSTPDTHIFEQATADIETTRSAHVPRTDGQLYITYEIQRTVQEIRTGKWKRIALQFPDHMLPDAPWVFKALSRHWAEASPRTSTPGAPAEMTPPLAHEPPQEQQQDDRPRLFILGDTSYGSCCVDEVAAEHADADVVVHYGRSCLSPTARLPVIYVFTNPHLDVDAAVNAFKQTYPNQDDKIILAADIPFMSQMPGLGERLRAEGYRSLFVTKLEHNTSSPIPNRTVPSTGSGDESTTSTALQDWQLFHVSDPPESLLLTLASRIAAVHILSTTTYEVSEASSTRALRRRYATLIKLATVPIFGILINTLSVANYMSILAHVKQRIAAAGKKSYTFVVGKVNAAKVANFSEVGGWVVIGCWESSLLESKEFWKPVITPFELEYALMGDESRVWTGAWSSDFEQVLAQAQTEDGATASGLAAQPADGAQTQVNDRPAQDDEVDADESAPPEFDLRTGRYVSQSRPMQQAERAAPSRPPAEATGSAAATQSVVLRASGALATIGGQVSPAAEFFKNQRSWQGLGSDFAAVDEANGAGAGVEGAVMESGRVGIAKGYAVGDRSEGEGR